MYDHPILQKNISILFNNNIEIIDPYFENNNIKIASISVICARVIRNLSKKILDNKKILIIGGSCCEHVDAVRNLCNISSGLSTVAFAKQAYYLGASVEIWYGKSPEPIPDYLFVRNFCTISDIKALISQANLCEYDIIIVCAALSDYIPEKMNGKIASDNEILTITCKKAEKILSIIRKKAQNTILIGFKLDITEKTLLKKSENLLKQYQLDYVIANTTKSLNKIHTKAWIITDSKIIPIEDTKENLALSLYNDLTSM
jgi:phosphopantothenoylcysteine decarboxylase/phosphopantothenate--cysteine ligase